MIVVTQKSKVRPHLFHLYIYGLYMLMLGTITSQALTLPVGGIINVKPKVEARAEKKKDWSVVGERYTLAYGDYIRTDKNGKADVLFNNGTEIIMRSNTQIQVVAPASADKPLIIRVIGALSEILVRAKGETEIRTEAGNAAVRGTEFLIRLPSDDSTMLSVVEGIVDFYNPLGKVTVRENQQSTATVDTPPSPPITIDVTGLLTWTADIANLPLEYETPMLALAPEDLAKQQQQLTAQIQNNPNDVTAHRQLACVFYDNGNYSAAIRELDTVIRLSPDDVDGYLARGTAYRASSDITLAKQDFQYALQLAPANLEAHLGLVLTLLANHDITDARTQLATLPNTAQVTAIRGLLEMRDNNPQLAVPLLTEAIASEPAYYQAYALLAFAQLTRNALPQAEDAARKAVALQPNSQQAQATLALVLFFENKGHEATLVAERASAMNPFSAFSLLTQGRVLLAQAKINDARYLMQQALALAPNNPIVCAELGQAYLRLGMLPKAETSFRKALSLQMVSADVYAGLGACLQLQGRTHEAIDEYSRALTIDTRHASARIGLATIYIEQGELGNAEQELRLAAEEQPEHGMLYARLAMISLYRQQLFQAQLYAQRSVSLLPNSAITHFVLGQVYQEQGRTVQAGDQFRLAATLDPQYAAARYALGVIRESAETGIDLSHPLATFSAAVQGNTGSTINVQNMQAPGVADRIQAAIQDPAIIRIATRSFGDLQLDGLVGENETQQSAFSYIHETENRRGVISVLGRHEAADGVRENADRSLDQISVSGGWKNWETPSALFGMVRYAHLDRGNDLGLTSDPLNATSRTDGEQPSLLLGGHVQLSATQRTSAVVLEERPYLDTEDMFGHTNNDVKGSHGEIRHDMTLGDNHLVSVGISTGTRKVHGDSLLLGPPGFGFDMQSYNDIDIHWQQAYLHDVLAIHPSVSIFSDLQLLRMRAEVTNNFATPPPPMIMKRDGATEVGIPALTVAWQPTQNDGVRLRARGVAGSVQDFQLLNPTEVFLFDTPYLPMARMVDLASNVIGRGHVVEAEFDHTFSDSSFLRIGLLDQKVRNALSVEDEVLPESTYRSISLRVEKVLTPTLNGIFGATFIDAQAITQVGDDYSDTAEISGVPRYVGEVGLQYLHPSGWFIQSSVGLIGPRMQRYAHTLAAPRIRHGAFAVTNLRAGKRFGLRSTAYMEIANLFDERYSLTITGQNQLQSGREFRMGMSQRF